MSDEFDFSAMLQQAQALQEKLKQMQGRGRENRRSAVGRRDGAGGGGRLDASAQDRNRSVASAADDQAMLEDLIVVAVNDGLRRAQELVAEEMGKLAPWVGSSCPASLAAGPE